MNISRQEILNNFLNFLKFEKNYSQHTLTSYKNDITNFYEFLERQELDFNSTNFKNLRFFLADLNQGGISKRTQSRKISALRSFYKYMLNNGYVKDNPFLMISTPKQEKKNPRFLYYNDLENILESLGTKTAIEKRNKMIFELMYATGLRASEVCNIKIDDIDFDSKQLKTLGKGKKERIVFFGDSTKNAIIDYIANGLKELQKEDKSTLILSQNGKKIGQRSLWDIINKTSKKFDISLAVHPHMLRHTFATHLVENGADLRSIQEMLGHANLSSTQIYTHVTKDKIKEVYNKAHPRANKR